MSTSAGRRYDALLFDLDGTLIDSMPLHQRAWARWLAEQGQPLEEDARFFASTAGRSGAEILAGMFPQADAAEIERLSDEREALYRAEARQHLQAVAGALELLRDARAQGFRLAVCTAAPPANIALA